MWQVALLRDTNWHVGATTLFRCLLLHSKPLLISSTTSR